jgi:hypothetical protein
MNKDGCFSTFELWDFTFESTLYVDICVELLS